MPQDPLKHIRDDFAVRRMVAKNRGDDDEMRRIEVDERETFELLGQPSVRVFHSARPGHAG